MEHSRVKIEQLAGQDGWPRWKVQVLLQLQILKVKDIVTGDRVKPELNETFSFKHAVIVNKCN